MLIRVLEKKSEQKVKTVSCQTIGQTFQKLSSKKFMIIVEGIQWKTNARSNCYSMGQLARCYEVSQRSLLGYKQFLQEIQDSNQRKIQSCYQSSFANPEAKT